MFMGSNTKNTPDQKTIDFMMRIYKSAEPYDFDDPRLCIADCKDEEINKRADATLAKKWLIDVGILTDDRK